jgi:uncharacterized membrane protein YjjB (DUF3815 family)
MHEDRVEQLIAAVIGALLGIITSYLLGHGWALTVIWALIGAVVVSANGLLLSGLFGNECPPLVASRRLGQLRNAV